MKNSFLIIIIIGIVLYYIFKPSEWFIYSVLGNWFAKYKDKEYSAKKVNYTKDGKQNFFGTVAVWYYLDPETNLYKIIPSSKYNFMNFIEEYNIPKQL